MLSHICLVAIPFLLGVLAPAVLQTDPNYVVNGNFENGLSGWTPTGDVRIEKTSPIEGATSARLGEGKASICQRYKITGLRIMGFGAKAIFGSTTVRAKVRVRCFNARNRLVMDLSEAFDPQRATTKKGAEAELYFKTQAHTEYMVVCIEKEAGPAASVFAAWIHDDDKHRVEHAPNCDLDAYMHPIWDGNTVIDESVLLVSTHGAPARGKLLFTPTKILSLKDSSLQKTYKEGIDFTLEGDEIRSMTGSAMPSLKDSDFPTTAFPWLSVAGKHVFVTYEHASPWAGPIPAHEGGQLPRATGKLIKKRPLTIVAYGDSITLGINVSGYRMEPPYMPTWPELATWQLKRNYRYDRITLYNAALGGMTAKWGRDNARDAVASLNPDLVIIAFGMNDFWSVSPSDFRDNIAETIKTIRVRSPKAEFILISPIRFDPAYTADPLYTSHISGYQSELTKLAGDGISLLDFTALSDFLYKVKSAKDLLADPMHPDDFLARIFAQFLVKSLIPPDLGKRVN